MKKIQDIFDRIQEVKNKQKEIKSVYKDALVNSGEYQQVVEELKELKEKKKKIESIIQSDFKSDFAKLDSIKIDLETDNMLLSDIALNHVMKGEVIDISDQKDNRYEPIFSVKFKKI